MENLSLHPDALKQLDSQHHRQALQRASTQRLLRATRGRGHAPRLSRQQEHLLHELGDGLIRLGHRLAE